MHHQPRNDKRQIAQRNQDQAQQPGNYPTLAHLTKTGDEQAEDRGDARIEWLGLLLHGFLSKSGIQNRRPR